MIWKIAIALPAIGLAGCDLFGTAKVAAVIKRGAPMAALSNQIDIERVAALIPTNDSYLNKTTASSLQISGQCISESVAVRVTIALANLTTTIDCSADMGYFSTTFDLSSVADGPIDVKFEFLRENKNPIFEVTSRLSKLTADLPPFTLPTAFTESNEKISWTAVEGAASYNVKLRQHGTTGSYAIDTSITAAEITVSSLAPGTTYDVWVTAVDAAGNEFPASNFGPASFLKSDTTGPVVGALAASTSVGMSGFTLNWTAASDNVTLPGSLQYYVCSGTIVSDLSTVAKCEAATQEMDWSLNTLTLEIISKKPSTTYQYAVLVKDAVGNKSVYASLNQTTAVDTQVPSAGSLNAAGSVTAIGFALTWTAGSDNGTDPTSLKYYVCSSTTSAAAIDTPAKCLAATQEMNWTTNALTTAISGKAPLTTYYYDILVKDAAGNMNLYGGGTQATVADTTAPTVGSNSVSTGVSATGFTLNWTAAIDDVPPQTNLLYYVCSGASAAAINTVAACEGAGATMEMDWSVNTLTLGITGKSASTTYYYNVIVKDPAGNKAIYGGKSQTTSSGGGGTNYTFMIPVKVGNDINVVKHVVSSSSNDASGTTSTSSALVTLAAGLSDHLSLTMGSDDKAYVVYDKSNAGSTYVLGYNSVDSSSMSLGTETLIDNGFNYIPTSVDIALNASSVAVFWSGTSYNGGSTYAIRKSVGGGASAQLSGTTPGATFPSTHLYARFNSLGDQELVYRHKLNPFSYIVRRYYDDSVAALFAQTQDFVSCSSDSVSSLAMVPTKGGDDVMVLSQCGGALDQILVTDNIGRTSSGAAYTWTRSGTSGHSTNHASNVYSVMERSGKKDAYYVSDGGNVEYCDDMTSISNHCRNGPTTVYTRGDGETVSGVRVARTSDDQYFVIFTVTNISISSYLKIAKRLTDTSFSSATTLASNNGADTILGKRVGVVGVPDNSNWTTKHSFFVSSATHNGALEGLTPDALCRGYAFGARLPRALSTKAVLNSSLDPSTNYGGTRSGDVYTNASSPSLFKSMTDFTMSGVDPGASAFYTQAGTAVGSTFDVWIGDVSTAYEYCGPTFSPWTVGTSGSDGRIINVGNGNGSLAWFQSSYSTVACNNSYRLMCITK